MTGVWSVITKRVYWRALVSLLFLLAAAGVVLADKMKVSGLVG